MTKYLLLITLFISSISFSNISSKCEKCLKNYRVCLTNTVSNKYYNPAQLRNAQEECKDKINTCAKGNKCK